MIGGEAKPFADLTAGGLVDKVLHEHGLTPKELSRLICVDQRTIYHWRSAEV